MPPAIPIIATLAADALGSTLGAAGASALGVGAEGILGTGITGAEVGGALGGGLTAGLMNHSPIAGVLGAASGGLGGDSMAAGIGNLASDVGLNLGLSPAATAATGAAGATGATVPATGTPTLPTPPAAPVGGGTSAGAIAPAGGGVAPLAIDPTATSVAGALNTALPPTAAPSAAATSTVPVGTTATAPAGATAAAPAAGAAPAAPNTVEQMFKDPTFGNAWNVLKANPSAVLGALGLGYNIMNQGSVGGLDQLKGVASQANRTSQELTSYINSGQLPPGFQASMDQAKQAAKAQIRSKYAGMGMSGSTAETQDLANVDVQAVAAQAGVAADLLKSGIQESGVAGDLLARIVGINQEEDTATGQAISNFAASMGGGVQPLMLRLGAG